MRTNPALGRASMEAQRLLAHRETSWDEPIDVFKIVQDEGIWLVSKPLGAGLYGFYLREGDATGIVVNANHPETLQRYTAAHELGHHVLGHESHLDGPDDVKGPIERARANELAAQVFAGNLLMPLQAVNRALRRQGVARQASPTAAQAYMLARDLDVSFSAAVWQLVNLRRLNHQAADNYVRAGAAAIKRELRSGDHPEGNNRADLVLLDQRSNGLAAVCRIGDELRVRLPENPSTGYQWRLREPATAALGPHGAVWDGGPLLASETAVSGAVAVPSELRVVLDTFLAPSSGDVVGGDGVRELVMLADEAGPARIQAVLARPWQPDGVVEEFGVSVRVAPSHSLEGFAERQIAAHRSRVTRRIA